MTMRPTRNNPDLTSNLGHPENAIYLRPLLCAADEADAREWAAISFSCDDGHIYPDTEEGFEQCLADHRRMFCELEYWLLVLGKDGFDEEDFPDALQPLRKDH